MYVVAPKTNVLKETGLRAQTMLTIISSNYSQHNSEVTSAKFRIVTHINVDNQCRGKL